MKKLFLLLLFVPLVSLGQNDNVKKKNIKETDIALNGAIITASMQKIKRKNKRKKPNDINLSKNESDETYNPFLDCDINDNSCFQNLINQYVLDNFNYPELGSYFDVQAMVYVDYTIDTKGIIKNVSSKAALIGVSFEDVESKNIMSATFEKAANIIIENLPALNPSIIDSVTVSKKFRTPILYRLIDIKKDSNNSININKINIGIDFLKNQDQLVNSISVYEAPVFPGCEDMNESEKKDCFQNKIYQHISRNFWYPETAQKMGIQGIINVQFLLGKDGRIRELSSTGKDLTLKQEAERIISLLPKIYPGKINGLRRVVTFNIPITFKLM
ncbi:energy transducer TonB [Flavobacteriaceae bacterium]|nr:energy transducer TonB [Flavobacteriaceae bacterium]MDC0593496.1 energy transducer TonB [Flavobacteriaceae bacterium]MDC1273710.1 energy transducer TonB [Flavobacteriaceae bacterium]